MGGPTLLWSESEEGTAMKGSFKSHTPSPFLPSLSTELYNVLAQNAIAIIFLEKPWLRMILLGRESIFSAILAGEWVGEQGRASPASVSVSTRPFLSWLRVDVCLQLDILVGEAEAELPTF